MAIRSVPFSLAVFPHSNVLLSPFSLSPLLALLPTHALFKSICYLFLTELSSEMAEGMKQNLHLFVLANGCHRQEPEGRNLNSGYKDRVLLDTMD